MEQIVKSRNNFFQHDAPSLQGRTHDNRLGSLLWTASEETLRFGGHVLDRNTLCSNEDSRELGRNLGYWEYSVYQIAE